MLYLFPLASSFVPCPTPPPDSCGVAGRGYERWGCGPSGIPGVRTDSDPGRRQTEPGQGHGREAIIAPGLDSGEIEGQPIGGRRRDEMPAVGRYQPAVKVRNAANGA